MEKQENQEGIKAECSATCECPNCFLLFEIPTGNVCYSGTQKKLCSYCESHPHQTSLELLKRRLDTLDNQYVFRYADIMRHLIKHLELKE